MRSNRRRNSRGRGRPCRHRPRTSTSASHKPRKSARAPPVRVTREAPYLKSTESEAFGRRVLGAVALLELLAAAAPARVVAADVVALRLDDLTRACRRRRAAA